MKNILIISILVYKNHLQILPNKLETKDIL